MTFHAFQLYRDQRTTCPVCGQPDKVAALIAFYGHCGTCALRLQQIATRATDALAQTDLSLRFRASWAINILAGTSATSIVSAPRALPPSRVIRPVKTVHLKAI